MHPRKERAHFVSAILLKSPFEPRPCTTTHPPTHHSRPTTRGRPNCRERGLSLYLCAWGSPLAIGQFSGESQYLRRGAVAAAIVVVVLVVEAAAAASRSDLREWLIERGMLHGATRARTKMEKEEAEKAHHHAVNDDHDDEDFLNLTPGGSVRAEDKKRSKLTPRRHFPNPVFLSPLFSPPPLEFIYALRMDLMIDHLVARKNDDTQGYL